MSKESALKFRDKINASPELQAKVRNAFSQGKDLSEMVALGAQNGFAFTAEEAQEALAGAGEGELSDFELEMVAGGSLKPGTIHVNKPSHTQPQVVNAPKILPAKAGTIALQTKFD